MAQSGVTVHKSMGTLFPQVFNPPTPPPPINFYNKDKGERKFTLNVSVLLCGLLGNLYSSVTCLQSDDTAVTQSGHIRLCHLINWNVTSQMPATQCQHFTACDVTKCDAEHHEIGAQQQTGFQDVLPIQENKFEDFFTLYF